MNVATKVEIATSGTVPHGKLGVASAVGQAGTATESFSSTNAAAEKCFRASWQALLASLGSDVEESSKTAANQGTALTETEAGKASGKSSGTTSASSADSDSSLANLRLSLVAEKGNEPSSTAAKLSAADARAEAASTALTDAKTTKSVSTKTEENKSSTELKTKSVSSSTSTSSVDSAKSTNSSVNSAVDVVPAVNASVQQAVPIPVIVTPAASTTNEETQAMSSDLSTDLPTGFAATSSSLYAANSESASGVLEKANAAGITTGKESEKAQNQSLASSDSSESRSSDATLTTALPIAQGTASPSAELRTEDRNQLEVSASGLKQSQAAEPSQNFSQTLVSSQDATKALTSSQSQIQKPALTANRVANTDTASTASTDSALTPVSISAAARFGQPTDVSPIVNKSNYASSGNSSTSNTVRAARRSGTVDSVQMASPQGQSSSTVVDASAVAREVAEAHKAVSTSSESAGTSAVSQAGSSSSETFAALDAGSSTGSSTWIHAGAHRAEAGFQDPSLGWVSIRANTSGGGVHAQLMTDSTDAAQALSSQLTGLSAYLAEHRTPVETLTLTASDGGSTGWGSDQSAGQGMQQNTGQQGGQETSQGANTGSQPSSYQSSAVMTETSSQLQTGFDGSAQAAMPGGIRISVMA